MSPWSSRGLPRLGDPAAVGRGEPEAVAMQMNRMVVHRDRFPKRMRTRSPSLATSGRCRERLAVDGQHVEVGHLVGVRQRGGGRRSPAPLGSGRSRGPRRAGLRAVHDEHARHAQGNLHHLVEVRVVHERAGMLER